MRVFRRLNSINSPENYPRSYNDKYFWRKVKRFAVRSEKGGVSKALVPHYDYSDPRTPKSGKGLIVGTLGDFISPFDAIPDAIPIAGFADDLGALAAATALVAPDLHKAHVDAAKGKLKEWFG
jgi:uncharacterized membrane protein YkvA (DUF1232 family)